MNRIIGYMLKVVEKSGERYFRYDCRIGKSFLPQAMISGRFRKQGTIWTKEANNLLKIRTLCYDKSEREGLSTDNN